MPSRTFYRLLATALLIPLAAAGECAEAPQRINLSLKEGIYMLLERNVDITVERINPGIAEALVTQAEGEFDMSLFGSARYEEIETPLGARARVSAGGLSSTESENYTLDAGIEKKGSFGTRFAFEIRDDRTANTFNQFTDEHTSFAGFRLTQPLLKGFGRDANLANINIARKNREISAFRLKERLISAVADFNNLYWDLIRAREELSVALESERLAETLSDINRRKFEAGATSALEIVLSDSAAAARRDAVLLAEKAVRLQENALKSLIVDDPYALAGKEIVPAGEDAIPVPKEGLKEAASTALEKRPDYLELKSTIERARIRMRSAEDTAKPLVDLEASYGFNGLGDSMSEAFGNIETNPQWSVGLNFRYPLENRAAYGGLKAARLEADQARLRLKRLEQTVVLNIDRAIKDMDSEARRVEEAEVSVSLAREALEAEEKKLAAGRSTTYNVLRMQEDLARAMSNRSAAVSDYKKSLVRYFREKGTLLDVLGVNLTEAR